MGKELQKLTDKHYKILSLFFLECSMKEIAERTGSDYSVVRSVVKSELGREILAGMRKKALEGDVLDIRDTFKDLLRAKKDLPKQMMEGFVEEPLFTPEGMLNGTIKRRVDPELRLRAFKTVADIAGVGAEGSSKSAYLLVQVERLDRVKERARSLGKLAASEAEFEVVEKEDKGESKDK